MMGLRQWNRAMFRYVRTPSVKRRTQAKDMKTGWMRSVCVWWGGRGGWSVGRRRAFWFHSTKRFIYFFRPGRTRQQPFQSKRPSPLPPFFLRGRASSVYLHAAVILPDKTNLLTTHESNRFPKKKKGGRTHKEKSVKVCARAREMPQTQSVRERARRWTGTSEEFTTRGSRNWCGGGGVVSGGGFGEWCGDVGWLRRGGGIGLVQFVDRQFISVSVQASINTPTQTP